VNHCPTNYEETNVHYSEEYTKHGGWFTVFKSSPLYSCPEKYNEGDFFVNKINYENRDWPGVVPHVVMDRLHQTGNTDA